MAISSYQATLQSAAKGGSGAQTFEKLVDIKDFPDMLGEPNLLETTTLTNGNQTYILGIKQSDLLTFTANYTSTDFSKCKALEGTERSFKLALSDGSSFSWDGSLSMGFSGKGVDEVLEMTLNIAPSSDVEFNAGT